MGVIRAGTNIWVDAAKEESAEHNTDITEYPIECGSKINSHAHLLPRYVTVEGIVIGANKLARLKNARDSRAIVAYIGRMYYGSLVIKELLETYTGEIANGCQVRVVFQQVKIVGGAGAATEADNLTVTSDPAGEWGP